MVSEDSIALVDEGGGEHVGDGVVGSVDPGSGEVRTTRFQIGEAIKAVRVRGGVDEVVGEVEVLDHLLEQVFCGDLLDSLGGIGVGEGKIEVSTYSDVTVVVVGGLHL